MTRLLVINPNTSQSTTDRLAQFVPTAIAPGAELSFVTASFGAPYIACEASYAVASHAVLDAWASHLRTTPMEQHPNRVLIGCFGDPGLHALRESAACPVTGLAEASFIEVAAQGPFAIVTGGARWAPMLSRIALALGFGAALRHIETVRETGAELLANPDLAIDVLTRACKRAAAHDVRTIILGGAGLAGFAAAVQPAINVPVIDSVLAGARVATSALLPPPERAVPGFDVKWQGVSPSLTSLSLT